MMKARNTNRFNVNKSAKSEIDRLLSLSADAIRVEWRKKLQADVPRELSAEILLRMLVWKVQEEAFGGHDQATLRLLNAFANHTSRKMAFFQRLKPGTTIVREYGGIRHTVMVGEKGFVWNGHTFGSLSSIAQQITGVKWNGPRFFGLRGFASGRPTLKTS